MVDLVEAAGGLVVRDGVDDVEVLVIHRPRYDDWSLPKGKLDEGETAEEAALREVTEETGMTCRTRERLPSVRYQDRKGRPKRVRYWLMEVDSGRFRANDEVDQIEWLSPERAIERLTYRHDRQLVSDVLRSAGN